jgi:magnesium-transporting ATPase (P-type)
MDWIKKHVDTVIMLSAFASAMLWMNGKFNEIEKDITIIKTVLIMKNIIPAELCAKKVE